MQLSDCGMQSSAGRSFAARNLARPALSSPGFLAVILLAWPESPRWESHLRIRSITRSQGLCTIVHMQPCEQRSHVAMLVAIFVGCLGRVQRCNKSYCPHELTPKNILHQTRPAASCLYAFSDCRLPMMAPQSSPTPSWVSSLRPRRPGSRNAFYPRCFCCGERILHDVQSSQSSH